MSVSFAASLEEAVVRTPVALVLTALLGIGVMGMTAGPAAAASQVPATTVRVMPLGDSITWGVGSATTSSYRKPLWDLVAGQSRYRVRFVGTQVSGSLPGP